MHEYNVRTYFDVKAIRYHKTRYGILVNMTKIVQRKTNYCKWWLYSYLSFTSYYILIFFCHRSVLIKILIKISITKRMNRIRDWILRQSRSKHSYIYIVNSLNNNILLHVARRFQALQFNSTGWFKLLEIFKLLSTYSSKHFVKISWILNKSILFYSKFWMTLRVYNYDTDRQGLNDFVVVAVQRCQCNKETFWQILFNCKIHQYPRRHKSR